MAKKGLGQLLKSSLGADFVFKYNDATKEKIKRALADMREEIIDLIVERYVEDKLSSGDIKLNPITLGDRKIMEALAKEHTAEDTLELA